MAQQFETVQFLPSPARERVWIVLFLSAAILFGFMLFFADSGERAFVQATLELLKQEANVAGGVEPPCDEAGSPTRA